MSNWCIEISDNSLAAESDASRCDIVALLFGARKQTKFTAHFA